MPEKSGAVSDRTFGRNAGIDTIIEIRSEDANLTYQTSAQTLEILSADAADDGQSSGTLTLVSAVANAFSTGTVTCLGAQVGDSVTINGLAYTAVSGTKVNNITFDIDGDDEADATDLVDSVNNDVRAGTSGDISAANTLGVVTFTTDVEGVAGDAITLVSSDGTRMAVDPGAVLENGVDADTATVNGLVYTGVAGAKVGNTQFSIDASDTAAALDLAASIDQDTRVGITVPGTDVSATSAVGVVTVEAEVIGSGGDLVDIAGTTNITASAATLTDVGTGAHSVTVEGLDSNFTEVSETISVNGTTAKDLTQTFIRVNRAYIKAVGSGGRNVGLITIQVTSGGDVQITIPALQGQSQVTSFSVPFNREVLLKSIDWSVDQVGGNAVVALIEGQYRNFNEGWREFFSVVAGNGSDSVRFDDAIIFPPKTDIRFLATKQNGTGDVSAHVGYQYKIQRG